MAMVCIPTPWWMRSYTSNKGVQECATGNRSWNVGYLTSWVVSCIYSIPGLRQYGALLSGGVSGPDRWKSSVQLHYVTWINMLEKGEVQRIQKLGSRDIRELVQVTIMPWYNRGYASLRNMYMFLPSLLGDRSLCPSEAYWQVAWGMSISRSWGHLIRGALYASGCFIKRVCVVWESYQKELFYIKLSLRSRNHIAPTNIFNTGMTLVWGVGLCILGL